jgi:tripartite-type tricarboxylate transporter receptor subunit TctC
LAELGYPDVGTLQWLALFAPNGVPREIVNMLHKAAVEAANAPAVQERFKQQSIRPVPTASADDAQRFIASEFARWRKITSEVKIDLF